MFQKLRHETDVNFGGAAYYIPVSRAKKTFHCFVIGPINYHSESENVLKFLLTRANFSKFNPGDVSWIKGISQPSDELSTMSEGLHANKKIEIPSVQSR